LNGPRGVYAIHHNPKEAGGTAKKINMQIRHFPTGDGHKNAITQKAREEPKEM